MHNKSNAYNLPCPALTLAMFCHNPMKFEFIKALSLSLDATSTFLLALGTSCNPFIVTTLVTSAIIVGLHLHEAIFRDSCSNHVSFCSLGPPSIIWILSLLGVW
ncbi:hypothetical protein V6N13_036812 [Hibiscus sabdariffa]